MLQDISMLDLRKKAGQILDETFYQKYRFVIKRRDKPMAVLIPIEDYETYFDDKDIEIYTKERIKEFEKEDRISKVLLAKVKRILEA